MRSYGVTASSLHSGSFAVFPETNSVHQVPATFLCEVCRPLGSVCVLALMLVFSATPANGALSFSSTSANFGSVTVGTTKSTSVTITNSGRSSITISSFSMQAAGYGVSGLTLPQTLAAGQSVTAWLKFSPSSTGFYSGYISFSSKAPTRTTIYSVSGTGVGASTLAVTPSAVSFGTVASGTTNSQTVQIKNTGATAVTLSGVTASGTGFAIRGISLPLTLAAAQTANFTVAFSPAANGSVMGSVTITGTATSPYTLPLSGSGSIAARTLAVSTAVLNFGNEVVGGSLPLGVQVINTGNSSVTISSISVTGVGFSVGPGISGATIAAGQSAQLSVVFAPKTAGSASGTVTVISSANNSPNSLTVTGTGVSSAAHSVQLNWAASGSSSATGYQVYRSTTSGGSYARITGSAVNSLTYVDGSVSAGKTYYYVVTAVDSGGFESAYSGQAQAVIP
jgi:hypothetical protein